MTLLFEKGQVESVIGFDSCGKVNSLWFGTPTLSLVSKNTNSSSDSKCNAKSSPPRGLLGKLKELYERKKQGLITEKEFEKQKTLITESQSLEIKKKEAELELLATQKEKQEEILDAQKKHEAELLALNEYGIKFPLHAAVLAKDRVALQNLLQNNQIQINSPDNNEKTAWDLAYGLDDSAVSFDFCKMLQNAGGVSFVEIQKFENEKKKANLAQLVVATGIEYNMDGFQPFADRTVLLIKSYEADNAFMRVQEQVRKMPNFVLNTSFVRPGTIGYDAVRKWEIDFNNLMVFIPSLKATTDTQGIAVFEDLEKGQYLVVFSERVRKNAPAVWALYVNCAEKNNKVLLSNNNALFLP
jgi:hypothetical protein